MDSFIPFSPPLPAKKAATDIAEQVIEPSAPAQSTQAPGQTAAWREELSDRLEDFRRKRSRIKGNFDPNSSLDLKFEEPAAEVSADEPLEITTSSPSRDPMELDVALTQANRGIPVLDSVPLQKTEPEKDAFETAEVEPEIEDEEPVEIVLESNPVRPPMTASRGEPGGSQVAPLGQRFIAALADGLVLLMGFGVFAAIFWAAGGRITPHPLTLAIFGAIVSFFILAYFGLFTTLGAATPGLLWMELEVRNAQGGPPTPQESFWRAFGYLISIASLMLGFVWSSVDGDHLSWHDHMSGTYIARIGK